MKPPPRYYSDATGYAQLVPNASSASSMFGQVIQGMQVLSNRMFEEMHDSRLERQEDRRIQQEQMEVMRRAMETQQQENRRAQQLQFETEPRARQEEHQHEREMRQLETREFFETLRSFRRRSRSRSRGRSDRPAIEDRREIRTPPCERPPPQRANLVPRPPAAQPPLHLTRRTALGIAASKSAAGPALTAEHHRKSTVKPKQQPRLRSSASASSAAASKEIPRRGVWQYAKDEEGKLAGPPFIYQFHPSDVEEAEGNFALRVHMQGIEEQDRQQARWGKKSPKMWNGKPLIIHYLSTRPQDRTERDPHDIQVCCSDLQYDDDNGKYVLQRPYYVRAGLLWPVCGTEVGTWIRRHRQAEEALGDRKDHENRPLMLKIAIGVPYEALLVLCPFICVPDAQCQ